jgi:hypothetical protein
LPQSGFVFSDYEQPDAPGFDAEWTMDVADAQTVAERMMRDLSLNDMVLVGAKKPAPIWETGMKAA